MKKRSKKNKNNTEEEVEEDTSSKLTFDIKEYIKADLSTPSSQLKYKPLVDILSKAVKIKESTHITSEYIELFKVLQSQKQATQIDVIKAKYELIPIDKDKAAAKEKYDIVLKKAADKDKFQQMLVTKGNKLSEDKMAVLKKANEDRNNLIKEAEEYVQSLQKLQEDSLPEREKLIEENTRLRKEIENCLKDSMKIKEEFDQKIKENEAQLNMFDMSSKGGLEKMMEGLTSSAQKNVMENSTLKTEIMTYEQKIEELKKICDMANTEYGKLRTEVDNKKNESVLIAAENLEIKKRLKKNKINKEEIMQLFKEYESGRNKVTMMENLHKKYSEQYDKLYLEKNPLPEKIEEPCCGHEHKEGEEHHHDHEHDHHHCESGECDKHEHSIEQQDTMEIMHQEHEITNNQNLIEEDNDKDKDKDKDESIDKDKDEPIDNKDNTITELTIDNTVSNEVDNKNE